MPASSYAVIPYQQAVVLDLSALDKTFRIVNLEGDLALTTTNLALGLEMRLRLNAGSAQRALTMPSAWVFLSDTPTTIQASKTAVLSLAVFGTADADVIASYAEQP